MDARLLATLLLALAAGCLEAPGYGGTMYRCVDDPICPSGFTCVAGTCVVQGEGDAQTTDPTLVAFATGTFEMGCTLGTTGCLSQWAKHEVELSAFAIQKHEVSQLAYDSCVQRGACMAPAGVYDPTVRPNAPVRGVSSVMAQRYCSELGMGMRLPTEAEWERAVRTLDELYPWGNDAPSCTLANYDACATGAPADVDQYPSKTGLFHAAGNVREWVEDYFLDNYYATSPRSNPKNVSETGERVLRGGSYATGEPTLRVWYRDHADRVQQVPDAGIRCAKSL